MGRSLLINFKMVSVVSLGFLFFASGCQEQDTSEEWTRVLDDYAEAWNTGNLELLDGIIDAQYVRLVGPTISADGLDSLKKVIASFREVYPDFHVAVDQRIHSGNLSASRWSFTGTHSGLGNPALKGKQVSNTGMNIIQMTNGKLVKEWLETNQLPWMLQLGYVLTPPTGADE